MGRRHEALADEIHVRMRSLSEQPPDGCFCCAANASTMCHHTASIASHTASHRTPSHRIAPHRIALRPYFSILNPILIAMQLHPPFYPPTGAKAHAADLRLLCVLRLLRVLRVLFWTLARARCKVLTKTCVFLGNGAHLSLKSVHGRK